ncbi:lantibiotic dehydratase family protein [Chryseobacterium chendengshani]|uniref:lantibiotic dehydratase family protein n=1 Tax=Chryseobacterium sp. LJ668 TaxID=2864040 RepID=UPI001C6934DE|nr:lantibiotic dehydratase family protein [Chryseobacterium sp. LJ668]MBW8522965.1 lantibiotic dehydratase family protein [Chryseobacterium sp. LJ668]QYK16494.1 lantibiotic dehydratase family protein [Chryseobacterium sp. LJ668]
MNEKYINFNKFLLRTPALGFNIDEISKVKFEDNLLFKEAIFISSIELYYEMEKFFENRVTNEKEKEKIFSSLFKYWRRMRTRTTPYGLFSAVTAGSITSEESTEIIFNNQLIRFTRLDMEVICSIIEKLEKIVKYEIFYFPNDTLYNVHNEARYYEAKFSESKYFKYSISSVHNTSTLKKILKYSQKGAKIENIVSFVTKIENGVSDQDAEDFILELIDSKILISEITPAITNGDPLNCLISILIQRNVQSDIVSPLINIKNIIENYNSINPESSYKLVIDILDGFGNNYSKKNIFQIDLYKGAGISNLNKEICDDILSAVLFLTKLDHGGNKNENLELFKKVFTEKFNEREVDFLFVCDADVGIGYPVSYNGEPYLNDLIKGLRLPSKTTQGDDGLNLNSKQKLLFEKILETVRLGENEIILTDKDFENKNLHDLYPTFYCSFEIVGKEDDQHILKLNSAGGNSGANLLARFSHMSADIDDFTREIAKKEQELTSLPILEMVHIPNPRIGNVIIRPQMRDYELTILTNSSLPDKKSIPVSDLTISIINDKIIIKSKTLNSEVKIAHTNALNHSMSNIPAFGLLCDIQNDNENLLGVSLTPSNSFKYIPRVKYKNVILSPATWFFKKEEIENNISKDNLESIGIWREKYKIPQFVIFCEADNELFIDFLDENSIMSLFEIIKKNNFITLKEFLFDSNCSVARDLENNVYKNEFIVSFFKNEL